MLKKIVLLLIIFALYFQKLSAQENDFLKHTVQTGTGFLGGWAVGNLAVSGLDLNQSSGADYYFHEMNMYWGGVNLALTGFTLFSKKVPNKMDKIYLVNAFLDLAYIGGGWYLYDRGLSTENLDFRWQGYGKSIILQGSFLLFYDAIMYFVVRKKMKNCNLNLSKKVSLSTHFSGNSFALKLNF